ncbi:MAG: hypothetical protein EPO65_01860 [Dehalococcoidia bacterium]|nr:MAG: hypothetical protein EPO65_01860 [Dehalococcoidia bacterium]
MTSEDSRAALMRLMQAVAVSGDIASALQQHVTPSIVVHMPNGDIGQGAIAAGFLGEGYEAFPDLTLTLESMTIEGDRAALQFSMEGTHTGAIRNFPPTGKVVDIPICTILRFEAGRIAEIWYYANLYAPLFGSLGVDQSHTG